MRDTKRATSEAGYNLIEVLVAIAILGVVLLSVVTLFFLGRGNVQSGKQMSAAVAVGTQISEDLAEMTVNQIYANFVIPNANAPTGTATVPSNSSGTASTMAQSSYPNSVVRSTYVRSATTELNYPNGYLSRWLAEMEGDFADPSVALVITPREPWPTTATLTMGQTGNATVLRLRVIVRWRQGLRYRQLILDSVKTKRPVA